ncbi:LacI family DNA-binding transcriptional regulator [Psychrobacillus sp. FSL K6-4615]|uniref:LacI family DNA-binding transcriptional regulator n=1 Tax=Psychrobacillus sp. FSL K6-4615 TaxID=2921551 RepID=UPI0030FAC32C
MTTLTIRDIAQMSGVSRGTVSKVINNYDGVSELTKRKVLEVIDKTGYQPTFSARSLATKKSSLIGLIYAGKINVEFNHPFFNEVISSFQKTLGAMGYDIIIFSNEMFDKDSVDYLARSRHYRLDGCLIIAGEEVEEAVSELDKSDIPCLGIDLELTGENSSYVMTDNFKVSQLAVEYLYLNSIRDVGYIAGKDSSDISNQRLEGFLQTMSQFGMTAQPQWIKHGNFFESSGYEAMEVILQGESLPKAIIAASDMMALGAMRAIKDYGLRIPQDIQVLGCDDVEACRYMEPALTTIKQDKQKIGRLAAIKLNDLINGVTGLRPSLVDPELVIRNSSGTAEEVTKKR